MLILGAVMGSFLSVQAQESLPLPIPLPDTSSTNGPIIGFPMPPSVQAAPAYPIDAPLSQNVVPSLELPADGLGMPANVMQPFGLSPPVVDGQSIPVIPAPLIDPGPETPIPSPALTPSTSQSPSAVQPPSQPDPISVADSSSATGVIGQAIDAPASDPPPLQTKVIRWYQYPMRWMRGWENHAEFGLDGSNGN
ncbi:MAG: hypothetical protein AAF539_10535, partial [Planctomycetota bacterium]